MKKVHEYWELLDYLNHIGFGGSPKNPIGHRQMMLCVVADALVKSAGAFPFSVTAHELRNEKGMYFPWLCVFEIRSNDGRHRTLRPANLV